TIGVRLADRLAHRELALARVFIARSNERVAGAREGGATVGHEARRGGVARAVVGAASGLAAGPGPGATLAVDGLREAQLLLRGGRSVAIDAVEQIGQLRAGVGSERGVHLDGKLATVFRGAALIGLTALAGGLETVV